jgi:hypothetical protein
MSRAEHLDVAAYALGALDEQDAERFEEHLVECWSCASELESLLPVVDVLAEVDPDVLEVVEQSTTDGVMLDRMLVVVGDDQLQARRRRMYSLAAGAVLLAMLTGGALFVGTRIGDQPTVVAGPSAPAVTLSTGPGSATQGQSGPGIGGPGKVDGEKLSATDEATGVRADLILESKPFGTQMSFALSRIPGPRTCRLVVLRKSGTTEVVSSWAVPPEGYGTAAQPAPLTLQAATAAPRDDIDRVQVQAVDAKGVATPLVTVRL